MIGLKAMTDEFNPGEWITTGEAVTLTGYDPAHIRRLVRAGQIDGKKFGRDWLVTHSSVEKHAAEMERLGSAKHDPIRIKNASQHW